MNLPVKHAPTLFLKAVVTVIGIISLILCFVLFPNLWTGVAQELPGFPYVVYPALIAFYATVIPFFIALYQAFLLLRLIDRSEAFSGGSVKALGVIKHCAIAIAALYIVCQPLFYVVAELDDAPGLIIFGWIPVLAPLVVATFAAVSQKLVRSAIDMKLEHDLTV